MPINPQHELDARIARQLYLESMSPADERADWLFALREARRLVADALRDSNYLFEIAAALRKNGAHQLVFRHLMAPPKSQDQFKLLCPDWPKGSEKTGAPVDERNAVAVSEVVRNRLDPGIGVWLRLERSPSRKELETLLSRVPPLIASQRVATARRSRLALEQEQAVIEMLIAAGWTRLPSTLIDRRAAVPLKHFMHKTRYATNTQTPQEVDIACGLKDTHVLAMECKVTNDETNSVKRINDVLKKAEAWRNHWGSFVETAALLQGVIAAKDVQRLTNGGVAVFWSHDLPNFQTWLNARVE